MNPSDYIIWVRENAGPNLAALMDAVASGEAVELKVKLIEETA